MERWFNLSSLEIGSEFRLQLRLVLSDEVMHALQPSPQLTRRYAQDSIIFDRIRSI